MKCPECNNELKIPNNTLLNMESYGNCCTTITECCGKIIDVRPKFSYIAYKTLGNLTEDDCGRKQK